MHEVGCPADYDLLWNQTNDVVFAHTRTVLWLIDREDGNKLYFINTVKYALHYGFAARYLDYGPPFTAVGTHGEFNILNYRRPGRRFLMGLLVHYQDQGLVTLELSAGDTADADMITDAYQRVRGALYDGDQLVYRPVSANQEALIPALSSRIPTVSTQAVFAGQSYQPLNPVVGYGTLRFRRLAQLEGDPLAPTDIAVVDRVPNDISLVSGLVTQEFQTPLAHVGLLAKNRGTPNMALRGGFDDPRLRAFEDQLVRLEVGAHDWSVRAATPAEAQAYWDTLRPAAPLTPHFDLSVTQPVDLADAAAGDAIRIGSKAANLAEVEKIRVDGAPIVMPDRPFAIPFHFYDQHMQDSGLYAVVDRDHRRRARPHQRGARAAAVRFSGGASTARPSTPTRSRSSRPRCAGAGATTPGSSSARRPTSRTCPASRARACTPRPARPRRTAIRRWPTPSRWCGRRPGTSRPSSSATSTASTRPRCAWACWCTRP